MSKHEISHDEVLAALVRFIVERDGLESCGATLTLSPLLKYALDCLERSGEQAAVMHVSPNGEGDNGEGGGHEREAREHN